MTNEVRTILVSFNTPYYLVPPNLARKLLFFGRAADQPLLSACWASPGMRPSTVSVRREIADVEAEVAKYEASNLALGEKLLSIQRQKRTVEEELVSENIRLKVVLDEHRERQQQDALPQNVSDRSVSQAELQTRIERALISVFEQKLEAQAEFEVIHRMGVCAHPEWSDPSQLYHPETTPMREVGGEGGVRTVQKS